MAGIDTSKGKLIFPPRFVPYLEKHRIFELFHELAELLVQERPKDHIKFLREAMPCAAKRRDKPRVVFFAPPSFDRAKFAKEVERIRGIPCITRFYLEMRAREERLKKKTERETVAEEEEYPCICPGEYELGEYDTLSYGLPSHFEEESRSENRSATDQTSENRTPENQTPENQTAENQTAENQTPENQTPENQTPENQTPEKLSSDSVEEEAEEVEDPCKGMRVCPCKEGKFPEGGNRSDQSEGTSEKTRDKSDEEADSDTGRVPVSALTDGTSERTQDKSDEEAESDTGRVPVSALTDGTSERTQDKSDEEAESDTGRVPVSAITDGTSTESTTGAAKDGLETKDSSRLSSCVCESSEDTVVDFGVLGRCGYSEKGWILLDFPTNAEEAELLSEQGALPTHAVRIITGGEEENNREYKHASQDWATFYKSIPVTDVYVNGRSITQLAESVGRLLRTMPNRHAPMLPRVALIGSRGSGASTQAKLLSKKYNIVHVDFEQEMARVILQDDRYGEMYKRQLLTRPDPELEAIILEKILLSRKYQRRGWVLTGFPANIDQLRMFDLMATPPNRIIFIEVPAKECFIRLYYRQTDWSDGKQYKLPVIVPSGRESRDAVGLDPEVKGRLMTHPKDDKNSIIRDIERYFEEKDEMMKYCGKTAAYVNGNKCVESVFEQIDYIIINPSPAEPPRDPLAIGHGIREAYERLQNMRMENGLTTNNLKANPPDPIFKL